jgi:hypothetical protein
MIIHLPQVVTQVAQQVQQHQVGLHDLVAFRHRINLVEVRVRHLAQRVGRHLDRVFDGV